MKRDTSISGDKINLTEDDEHIKTEMKTAEVLNSFFSNIVKNLKIPQNRSSRQEVFCKKGVPRNFAKFAGKHLCQSFFFNKVAALRLLAHMFSCEFSEISKNTFSYRTPPVAASVRTQILILLSKISNIQL